MESLSFLANGHLICGVIWLVMAAWLPFRCVEVAVGLGCSMDVHCNVTVFIELLCNY